MTDDWPALIHTIVEVITAIAALIGAIAGLGGFIGSMHNSKKISEVHLSINSRMDQLLEERGMTSRALGVEEERARARTPESR
jgi:hypothetical protein